MTKKWFGERFSKLNIALKYEEITKDKNPTLNDEVKNLILEIKEKLGLRGEKMVDKRILIDN